MQRLLKSLSLLLVIMMAIAFNGLTLADTELNSDAALLQITVNGIPLEGFDPEKQVYEMMLPSQNEPIPVVQAETSDEDAALVIFPAPVLPGYTVIEVRAEDGTTRTYIITFNVPDYREKSKDYSLCEIRVNGHLLKGFKPQNQSYAVKLAAGETAIPQVTAIANDPRAKVEIVHATDFSEKTVIQVTAEFGNKTTYTVGFLPTPIQTAKEIIKYDFDQIRVDYAAEFIAVPIGTEEGSWLANLAGGVDKNVTVTSGIVTLVKDGRDWKEEFIKFDGINGTERFLVNSRSFEYYEGTNRIKSIKSQYWSAKELQGSSVVKNFNGPIKAAILWREFDENQNMTAMYFTCYDDYQFNSGLSELQRPDSNYFIGIMDTLKHSGNPHNALQSIW